MDSIIIEGDGQRMITMEPPPDETMSSSMTTTTMMIDASPSLPFSFPLPTSPASLSSPLLSSPSSSLSSVWQGQLSQDQAGGGGVRRRVVIRPIQAANTMRMLTMPSSFEPDEGDNSKSRRRRRRISRRLSAPPPCHSQCPVAVLPVPHPQGDGTSMRR